MRTPASIFKHPIHPMLIVFPIGLWIFSLSLRLDSSGWRLWDAWSTVAFFSMIGGLIGALCAAVPGFIDLLFYKGGAPPVKKIALTHMAINLTAVVLYAINIWLRASGSSKFGHEPERSRGAFDYRRSAPLRIRLAWRPNGACLRCRRRRARIMPSGLGGDEMCRPRGRDVRQTAFTRKRPPNEDQTENSNERSVFYNASRSCIGQ